MPEIDVPGATLHYETVGDGPPLVLIAGFMSDSASWGPLLPLLAPHFTLICPDNRTTGRTRPWDAPVSMAHWTGDILALMDHLEIGSAPVLGHSLGGMIGWALAARAPDRVGALMTMGSAPLMSPRNVALYKHLIALRQTDGVPEGTWLRVLFPWLFGEAMFANPALIDDMVSASLAYPHAQSAAAMERQLETLFTVDPAPFKAPPPVPAFALLATGDLLVPHGAAKASLKGFDITDLNETGHSMHWDAPDQVADWVKLNARSAK